MEGKPPLALWFSHTGIIAYPPHHIQYFFSTPNTPLYSEIAEPKIGFSSLPGMTLWDSNIQKCILFFPVRYFNMEKYNIVPVRAYISGITSSIDENPRLALGGHYIVAYTNVIDPEYEGHYAILQINISHK